MIDIIRHIEYLIRRHDCVIVPGIGAFIVSYKSSYINEEWGIMTPPKREITFNSSIVNNDGLLANSISRKEGISFEVANKLMFQEIDRMRVLLMENEVFSIGRIGNLSVGVENNLRFEPFKNYDCIDEYYGLQSFKLQTLDELKNQHYEYNIGTEKLQSHVRSDKNYYIPVSKRLVRYVAMLIIVFMAAISMSLPTNHTSYTKDYASVLPISTDVVSTIVEKVDESKEQNEICYDDNISQTNECCFEPALKDNYYLIVASLTSEAEALKFIEGHIDGEALRVVVTPSMCRVYVAKSRNKTELIDIFNSTEFKKNFAEAWIWKPQN